MKSLKRKIIISAIILGIIIGNLSPLKNISYAEEVETIQENEIIKCEKTTKELLNILKDNYKDKDSFTFREAIGHYHSSNNIEKDIDYINSKLSLKDNTSASDISGNIIQLIVSGENPYNYNGINYVKELLDTQNKDYKFILGDWDDYPTAQAYAIIALDMAQADYNKNKTIKMLLDYQLENGAFSEWQDIDTVAMAITALGNHLNNKDVKVNIDKSIQFINNNYIGQNQYSLSAAIQALIAVKEDIESDKWTQDGLTILDRLKSFYTEEELFGDDFANEQVFTALADAYNNRSMYKEVRYESSEIDRIEILGTDNLVGKVGDEIKLNIVAYDRNNKKVPADNISWESLDKDILSVDKNGVISFLNEGTAEVVAYIKDTDIKDIVKIKVKEKEIDAVYKGDTSLKKGAEFKGLIEAKNLTQYNKEISLIMALYDGNKLINYNSVTKLLEGEENIEIESRFLLPSSNNLEVKIFIWDSLEGQNQIEQYYKTITR